MCIIWIDETTSAVFLFRCLYDYQRSTCLARLRASSRCRPRSSDLWTSLSQRAWTLSSRFLMSTTSCFRLAKRSWEPAFSRARTCSLWVFTSFTNTWADTDESAECVNVEFNISILTASDDSYSAELLNVQIQTGVLTMFLVTGACLVPCAHRSGRGLYLAWGLGVGPCSGSVQPGSASWWCPAVRSGNLLPRKRPHPTLPGKFRDLS